MSTTSQSDGLASTSTAAGGKSNPRGKKAKIYRPIPWLDTLLTLIFAAEVVWSVWAFRAPENLLRYGAALVLTAVAVQAVTFGSRYVGKTVSGWLPWRPLAKKVNLTKFMEQSWQLVAHVTLAAADWAVIWNEPWYTDTKTLWVPGPLVAYHKPSLKAVFMLQLGVWVYTCTIHRFFDKRRKDYFVMFAHHVVTIFLVAVSGFHGYYRVAVLILAIHDTSDIGVDLLKITNYLQLDGLKGFFITEAVFVGNLVVWCYFRLWIFPSKLMWTCICERHVLMQPADNNPFPGEPWKDPWNVQITMFWYGNAMLFALLAMHIWWTYLFLRIAYKLLCTSGGGHQAGREEYEGDSEIEGQSTGPEDADGAALAHKHD